MAASNSFTRTYTVQSMTASGADNITVTLGDGDNAAPSMTPNMSVTMSNAEAGSFSVHDTVTLTIAKS